MAHVVKDLALTKPNKLLRVLRVVDSGGRCNASGEYLRRSVIAERLARPRVQLPRNDIELRLTVGREVGAARQVLPQQPVRVFVAPPLPGTARITEIDLHVGGHGKRRV